MRVIGIDGEDILRPISHNHKSAVTDNIDLPGEFAGDELTADGIKSRFDNIC